MKVLYLISTFEKGVGGHYFSLQATLESLRPEITPVVVNVGRVESPVIANLQCQKHQFIYRYLNYSKIQKRIAEIIQKNEIEKIHCFDDRAYLFVRNSRFSELPLVVTKCGGPNYSYFPSVPNLILFSKENLDHFKGVKEFNNIHLVPNRILPFQPSLTKVDNLKIKLKLHDDSTVFLRIARISQFYRHSLEQSIRLIKVLENAVLLIVGQVIDEDVLNHIKKIGGNKVHIINDEEYCTNAKEIIPICDFYIGTGRGIMEATSLKKIVLTPVTGKKYPALVTKENFQSFFNTNFSERNILNISDQEILDEIKRVVSSSEKKAEMADFSFQMFTEHFDLNTKKDWYLRLYQNLTEGANQDWMDKFKHTLLFHYHYISQA